MEFNLSTVDWYIQQIKEQEEEIAKLKEIRDGRIAMIEHDYKQKADKIQADIDDKMASVRNWLKDNQEHLNTKAKTQAKFEGLSGEFVIKHPKEKIKYNKSKLLEKAEQEGRTEYIKVKTSKSFDWAAYKNNLEIRGGRVVDTTNGEVVDILEVEVEPERWEVK